MSQDMSPADRGRDLVLILGDQLSLDQASLHATTAARASILMAEVPAESTAPASSMTRTVLFLSAMRHFATTLQAGGWSLAYLRLGTHPHPDLPAAWRAEIRRQQPARVICTWPGDHRLLEALRSVCASEGVPLLCPEDDHFLISRDEFARWAGRSRTLLMERFYRHIRVRHQILMDGAQPVGGQWNFDPENRQAFGREGPGPLPAPRRFGPDELTLEVAQDVRRHLPQLPGQACLDRWPVTRDQALLALEDFVTQRLSRFGPTQDAMWAGEPTLFHALLASSLNLKLLKPREVIDAALRAHAAGQAPLASVEGFVRQVLGWREFMRGIYWLDMPELGRANHFGHALPLPSWFWSGATGMNCLGESIRQTLELGYAHHIQRLMVIGNFALLAGLKPQAVSAWFLAVYVDAVEWVELPNVAGMALYANGGRFTSKPYCASGAYIKRMSNYCKGCRYDPAQRTGPKACPISTLYWDFLIRHEAPLSANPRAALMMKHVARLDPQARAAISEQAARQLQQLDTL
jgi:deoxyribodipyrimidine photolyase-related protein